MSGPETIERALRRAHALRFGPDAPEGARAVPDAAPHREALDVLAGAAVELADGDDRERSRRLVKACAVAVRHLALPRTHGEAAGLADAGWLLETALRHELGIERARRSPEVCS